MTLPEQPKASPLRGPKSGRPTADLPPEAKFWARVAKTETCWLWTGAIDRNGYSSFTYLCAGRQRCLRGHRWAYTLLVGPIPPGLTIDHLCRVRRCVNPGHLEVVDQGENVLRGYERRRHDATGERRAS